MTATNKVKNIVQRAKGKTKGVVGKMTGNRRLEAAGKADEVKGTLKQAAEKAKDAFQKMTP